MGLTTSTPVLFALETGLTPPSLFLLHDASIGSFETLTAVFAFPLRSARYRDAVH